jgi:serine O-acetyltransferase
MFCKFFRSIHRRSSETTIAEPLWISEGLAVSSGEISVVLGGHAHLGATLPYVAGYAPKMTPERIWLTSIRMHRKGWHRPARVLKAINAFVYSTALPPEADVADDVALWHHGLGVVIHPDTKIGWGVQIAHGVTIGAGAGHSGSGLGVVIEDGASIGAGACIIPKEGFGLTLGEGCIVGANAVVTKDVPPYGVATGQAAVIRDRTPPAPDLSTPSAP